MYLLRLLSIPVREHQRTLYLSALSNAGGIAKEKSCAVAIRQHQLMPLTSVENSRQLKTAQTAIVNELFR